MVITAEPESPEVTARTESDVLARKVAPKSKGKKSAAIADSVDN